MIIKVLTDTGEHYAQFIEGNNCAVILLCPSGQFRCASFLVKFLPDSPKYKIT